MSPYHAKKSQYSELVANDFKALPATNGSRSFLPPPALTLALMQTKHKAICFHALNQLLA